MKRQIEVTECQARLIEEALTAAVMANWTGPMTGHRRQKLGALRKLAQKFERSQ